MSTLNFLSDITTDTFEKKALEAFNYQLKNNPVYREYVTHINSDISSITSLDKIPFLPIQFFKTHDIIVENKQFEQIFLSSGTTGMNHSRHLVADLSLYQESFTKGFEYFFEKPETYTILALLPSYLEQGNSSLVYMISNLIEQTQNPDSGFYLHNLVELSKKLVTLDNAGKKVLLIGVSYALLDLVANQKFSLKNTIIMETGGMKGRRKEMIKSELHNVLKSGFGVSKIYSEYGMTELLSQAYSLGDLLFKTPPWMKVLIREIEDPFHIQDFYKSGGINIIDLANKYSCPFIATQDLGKLYPNGSFEVLGRYDHSDIRGCNLMV